MNKTIASIVIAVSFTVGGIFGYVYGKQVSVQVARDEVRGLLDSAYPPPQEEVKTAEGKITSLGEAAFDLEIDDPEDYLPHADGSPRKKVALKVSVPVEAEVFFTDYSKFDDDGNPSSSQIKFEDLRSGDIVTLSVNENIRKTKSVMAKRVEVVKY